MPYLLNLLYLSVLTLFSPYLLYKIIRTGKYRRGLWSKLAGLVPVRTGSRRCVWFHGVSVGEVHLLRQVVAKFRQACPQLDVVVSTTTYTGMDEARKQFADLPVFYWPLDFTWSIKRALRRLRPDVVVLAESEIWPNFLMLANRFGIKVMVMNGRFSPRSSQRFQKLGWLSRWLLGKVDLWAMQNQDYANSVQSVGIASNKVFVTGNVKYDGVQLDRRNPKTIGFHRLFSVKQEELIWVAGSTQTPEEEVCLGIYQRLKVRFPSLRLILVPRQKERFGEVADLLIRSGVPCVRKSQLTDVVEDANAVILVDTIGDLAAVWGLADIAFVGGSLDGRRGGQNMIEPAAYAAAVLFGPHTWNFKETVHRLLERTAAIQITDSVELETQLGLLLQDAAQRQQLGQTAQSFVRSQQGATEKTINLLRTLLGHDEGKKVAA